MRSRLGTLLAALSMVAGVTAPASSESPPRPGFCASVKEFLRVNSDMTCSFYDDSPRPAARIHQTLNKAKPSNAATVKFCASGSVNVGRLRISGVPSNAVFRVRYSRMSDGVDITRAVVAGTYVTSQIGPNQCFRYRIDIAMRAAARTGDLRTFSLTANPEGPGWATLKAATHVLAYTRSSGPAL